MLFFFSIEKEKVIFNIQEDGESLSKKTYFRKLFLFNYLMYS